MKILTFSTRRQNSRNGVLDETTTANPRGRNSRAHARLCKFTSGSRPSSSCRRILRSLVTRGVMGPGHQVELCYISIRLCKGIHSPPVLFSRVICRFQLLFLLDCLLYGDMENCSIV